MRTITKELLKELFDYKNGNLYWKVDRSWNTPAGKKAGYTRKTDGYVVISLFNKPHKAHRLIYTYFYGSCPAYLDHVNNNRSDNRIENLRPATREQNCQNARIRSDNTSGIKGVSWDNFKNKWRAEIQADKKRISCGYHDTIEQAVDFIKQTREKLHKEFARHE